MSTWKKLVCHEERSDRAERPKQEPIPTFKFGIDYIRKSQKEEEIEGGGSHVFIQIDSL